MALRLTLVHSSSGTLSLFTFSKKLNFPHSSSSSSSLSLLPLQRRRTRAPFCASSTTSMASESSSLTHTITLPAQPPNPVQIVAAPGIFPAEFRSAIESSLFQQWLKNLQGEKGALTDSAMSLNKVLSQIEEETGINLKKEDMVELTVFLDPSTGRRIFPSPGGCDEEISVFMYKGQASKELIQQLQGKQTVLHEHGELITVHVVPYTQLWLSTPDAKVLTAVALYEMAKRDGLLPKF